DCSQEVLSIRRGGKLNLGDTREVLADGVGILLRRCAELVEVDLLIEGEVGLWSLTRAWIASVEESRAVRVPGETAARRSTVNARDQVRQRAAGGHIIDVHGTVLA